MKSRGLQGTTLIEVARKLGRETARRKSQNPKRQDSRLPALWLVTDPGRTPDPAGAVAALPKGAGVIYRAFGRADAVATGRRLATICRRRGLVLLVGADERLAADVGAAGLHLPQRMLAQGPRIRARRPDWILTGAAHDRAALAVAARAGLDAALLSPVFPSRSPSAGRPLGPLRFAILARGAKLPVYALGGVNARTAKRLEMSGAAGLAAVEALAR